MLDTLRWDDRGLVTVVALDARLGEVRMVAHADRDAVARTLETSTAWFWSRSRSALWQKGESSGNVLHVSEVWADCDGDALIYLVVPSGPTCHTGAETCFFRRLGVDGEISEGSSAAGSFTATASAGGALVASADGSSAASAPPARPQPTLTRLEATIEARAHGDAAKSYTRALLDGGPAGVAAKVIEEAGELAQAGESESDARVVSEAADLLFHALVLLRARRVPLRAVLDELARRFGTSGHAEKASRGRGA